MPACVCTGGEGTETGRQVQPESGSTFIGESGNKLHLRREIKYYRFGSGHLCRSSPVPFALRFEHGQPESPSLLSVPIFKGIRKKIEPAIFSQA